MGDEFGHENAIEPYDDNDIWNEEKYAKWQAGEIMDEHDWENEDPEHLYPELYEDEYWDYEERLQVI